jgi:hypothetical protein
MLDYSRRALLAVSPIAVAAKASPMISVVVRQGSGYDDTEAFAQAIAEATGGAIVVPPGIWRVRAGRLKLPPKTALIGCGRASVVRRIGTGTLFRISGTSTEDRGGDCLVRDIVLDGDSQTGTLVAIDHSSNLVFDNVWWQSNDGIAMDASELWDSRFVNCTWDWCSGADGHSPAVRLRNRADNVSTENTNALVFMNCRWESFRDGAVWIERTGNALMSQVHFTNIKMESSFVRGPFMKLSSDLRNVMIQNLYLCGNSFAPGFDVPVDLIDFRPYGMVCLQNVSVWLNHPVARTIVRAAVGHHSCKIENLWVDGPCRPTLSIVEKVPPVFPDIAAVGYLNGLPGSGEIVAQ